MKLWIDATNAPRSEDWVWAKTSQDAIPLIQGGGVSNVSIFLNMTAASNVPGINILRQIYLLAVKGTISRIRIEYRGADLWQDAQKAPVIIAEAGKVWTRREKKAKD
jgi:hypothetical protein